MQTPEQAKKCYREKETDKEKRPREEEHESTKLDVIT